MATEQKTNKNWEPTHLRLTIFPHDEYKDNPEILWPKIEGLTIEETKTKPQIFESVIVGSFNNKMVTLVVTPFKFDFIINPPPALLANDLPLPTLSSLGSFEDELKSFLQLVDAFFSQLSVTQYNRIAFGTQLIRSVKARSEGYNEISDLLFYKIDAKDTSDFLLQINKPTKINLTKLKDLSINRLTTWSVLRNNIGIGFGNDLLPAYKYPESYHTQLVLDINTDVKNDVIGKENISELFTELTNIGIDISKGGLK